MTDFKPSAVDLGGSFPPLCATFGKSEAECAAALLVRTLAANGDTWRSVTIEEVLKQVTEDGFGRVKPLCDMITNPFCEPDFQSLICGGFVVQSDDKVSLTLTAAGIERLRKWVRKSELAS